MNWDKGEFAVAPFSVFVFLPLFLFIFFHFFVFLDFCFFVCFVCFEGNKVPVLVKIRLSSI